MEYTVQDIRNIIFDKLTIADLYNLCITCKEYNKICEENRYWEHQCIINNWLEGDITIINNNTNICWKQQYKKYHKSGSTTILGRPYQINYIYENYIKNFDVNNVRLVSKGLSDNKKLVDINNNIIYVSRNFYDDIIIKNFNFNDRCDELFIKLYKKNNIIAKDIGEGKEVILVLDSDNKVWIYKKYNLTKELLIKNQFKDYTIFTKIKDRKFRTISVGTYHSLMIDFLGNVWSFGHNEYGQLGLLASTKNSTNSRNNKIIRTPTQISNFKAEDISAGKYHSLIIDKSNNVYSFGSNSNGQLGLNDYVNRRMPTLIKNNDKNVTAKKISAGKNHSLIIDLNNVVSVFGKNNFERLKIKDSVDENKHIHPTDGEENLRAGEEDDENINNIYPLGFKAREIYAGKHHNLIIDLDGNIQSLGNNYDENLEYISTQIKNISIPRSICVGSKISYIIAKKI